MNDRIFIATTGSGLARASQHPDGRWKVERLPKGGDVRKAGANDQASQLYVAFTPVGH